MKTLLITAAMVVASSGLAHASVESDLAAAKAELASVQARVAKAQAKVDAAQSKADKKHAMSLNDNMGVSGFASSLGNVENWKGSAEGGLNIFNGNTKSNDMYGKVALGHDYGRWSHNLTAEAFGREESANRTAEKYRAGWHSDYKFTERFFGFGELEWTKDRFSGYQHRIHEALGLGYVFVDNGTLFWEGRAGVGMQHLKDTSGDNSDVALGKLGSTFNYKISDNVMFSQIGEALFTEELETYRSETALKSKIAENLSFKAGYIVEKLSSVPSGRKKTDSHTFLGVVYDF